MSSQNFEIARLLILREARDGFIDSPTAFAWSRRIFPAFHAPLLAEVFADEFHISETAVTGVLHRLDERIQSREPFTYYDLEDDFDVRMGDGPQALDRIGLRDVLRYIYLDGRWRGDPIWDRLTEAGSGPVESQSFTKKFKPDEELDVCSFSGSTR